MSADAGYFSSDVVNNLTALGIDVVVDYIEMFYNSERLHSFNEYFSPNDYEIITINS